LKPRNIVTMPPITKLQKTGFVFSGNLGITFIRTSS
jgi:hypothetical protein